jgi:enoyl-CoA hydratase/carnithine racemase
VSVPDRVAEPVAASDPVLYEVRDSGVAVLTLNRPERMNGWGGGLATTFYGRLDDAEADPDIRAIVVTGTGRAFCAGADMGDLNTISNATVDAAGGLAVVKHQVYADTMRDVFEASAVAEKLMHESMVRPDFIEGITSFFEKRPPNFPPLKGQEQ